MVRYVCLLGALKEKSSQDAQNALLWRRSYSRMIRIPTRVVLPFGYKISVRQLTDTEMDKRDANADGIWDDESKTIYIRKRLPMTRRRYILAHELGHAWLDWQHRHLDEGKAST